MDQGWDQSKWQKTLKMLKTLLVLTTNRNNIFCKKKSSKIRGFSENSQPWYIKMYMNYRAHGRWQIRIWGWPWHGGHLGFGGTYALEESLLRLPTLPSVESLLVWRIIRFLISAAAPVSSLLWKELRVFLPPKNPNRKKEFSINHMTSLMIIQ